MFWHLPRTVDSFDAGIPVLDLLRYFRKDPWYQVVLNPPRLTLKTLYYSTLKTRLGVEIEERLDTIKERVIARKVHELLRGSAWWSSTTTARTSISISATWGCRTSPASAASRSSITSWPCTSRAPCRRRRRSLPGTALANNRILQSRLSVQISGLEDLEARIVLFDRGLSPDEEDGKQLGKFRFSVATDLLLQKSYRAFIVQKDREARISLTRRGSSSGVIRKIFDDIRTSAFENTRSMLKTLHLYRGKNQTLGQILGSRSEAIGAFLKLSRSASGNRERLLSDELAQPPRRLARILHEDALAGDEVRDAGFPRIAGNEVQVKVIDGGARRGAHVVADVVPVGRASVSRRPRSQRCSALSRISSSGVSSRTSCT